MIRKTVGQAELGVSAKLYTKKLKFEWVRVAQKRVAENVVHRQKKVFFRNAPQYRAR